MSNDIFERVAQLIDQFHKQAGYNSPTTKKAADETEWDEYDAGKRVPVKDLDIDKEMEEILSDALPNNPSVSSVEEGDEQTDVDNANPNPPDKTVADEEVPDVEVRALEGGEEAFESADKEAADVSQLSDGELLGKLASAAYQLLYAYAQLEPSRKLLKSGVFGKEAAAVYHAADVIKQAEYDADLLVGCILGLVKSAEDVASQVENLDQVTEPAADVAAAGAPEESPEEVLDSASPEEIQEVLAEDPQLAAAVAEVVAEESPEEVLDSASPEEIQEVLAEDPQLAAAVAEALDKEASVKMAEDEDPAQVLASASPEEIQEVLEENPEVAVALATQVAADDPAQVLAEASPEEIKEVLDEDPQLAAAVGQAVGADVSAPAAEENAAPPAEEKKEEEEPKQEGSENSMMNTTETDAETEEEPQEETKESSLVAKLAALSKVMEESGITPEEIMFYTANGPKAQDGVKVANAVRNFRNKFRGKNVKSADSPRLKEHMRQFLTELLS